MSDEATVEVKGVTESFSYTYDDKFAMEDEESRKIFINGDIDETIIDSAVYHILRYNRLDKGLPVEERTPIIIYINSSGGNVTDGYSLIDTILLSRTPVYTVNIGLAASMGFLVFLSGCRRYSLPHAEFLMHDGSTMGYDSTAKMRDRMEFETVELEKETRKYILSRTDIDEALYDAKYRCEWYFLPKTAKEIGAVDYILGEDCELDEII